MEEFDKLLKNRKLNLSKGKLIKYYWFSLFLLVLALVIVLTGFDKLLECDLSRMNMIVLIIFLLTSFFVYLIQRNDLKLRKIKTQNDTKVNFKNIKVLIEKYNWKENISNQYYFTADTNDTFFLTFDEKVYFLLNDNAIYFTCISNLDCVVVFPILSVFKNWRIRRKIRKELP